MKIRNIDSSAPVSREHALLGIPPVEANIAEPGRHPVIHVAMWFTGLVLLSITTYLTWRLFFLEDPSGGAAAVRNALSGDVFWTAALVGFIAQVIVGPLVTALSVYNLLQSFHP